MQYDSKQKELVHQLIDTVFDDDELEEFCTENFAAVADSFTPEMDKDQKIQALVESAAQYQQLGKLVMKIKDVNPQAYQNFSQQVQRPARQPRQKTEEIIQQSSAPTTITTFPVKSLSETTPHTPASRSSRGGEIILNAEAMMSQSLAGRYRIEEILDKSGLGAVFKAYDTKLEIPVAIKVIDLKRVKQPVIQERVRQEVRTAMQLDHPGIVKVYDFGQADSLLYIIMEYIAGYNLRQARQYFKTLESKIALPQIIRLFREICLTVDYMHQQRVLHPGTKPENILVKQNQMGEDNWRPVLINLGLLRPNKESLMAREDISARRLTYIVSPELLLGHSTDIRSDVYALGILLYDLAVGEPPFRPQDIAAAVRYHVETPPSPPRAKNPDISKTLEQIILKALAKNPPDRYINAKDMALALTECLDATSLPAPTPQSQVTVFLEARSLTVAPGDSLSTLVTLQNRGQLDDRCQIRVEGVPEEWLSITPAATTLAPGQQQEVEILIQPPRSPQSRAGRHTLAVQIISQYGSRQVDEIKKVLTIAPYSHFTSTLWPQEISTGQKAQVTVENHGNISETFTLQPQPDQALSFKPEQTRLKVSPGESGSAEFVVSTRRQLLVASQLSQTFSIDAIAQTRTDSLSGQVTSRGMLKPGWIFAFLLGLGLLACVVVSLWVSVGFLPDDLPTRTLDPQLNAARNATVQAIRNRDETATAQWRADDSDGDTLTNSQEIELYHTDPFKRDTDGDTIPDNLELFEYKTDPTLPDTDFDTIPDNVEIGNLSTPTSPDSDADGTPDPLDPDPVHAPTATPVNTPIPTSTLVPHTVGFSDPQPFLSRVSFFGSRQSYYINENQGPAVIEVQLSPPASRQVQVMYAIESSNAIAGEDYRLPGSNILVFNPPDSRQTITIEILNNPARTGDRRLILVLHSQSPGIQLGLQRIELVIRDITP